MKKNILISTGGTGGHVIPALTFYEHLKNQYEVLLLTDQRGVKFINNNYNHNIIYTPKITANIFLYPIKFLLFTISFLKSLKLLRTKKIKLVISTGGYMSFPVCLAAKLLGINIILFEPNNIIGKSNLYMLKFAKKIICYNSSIVNFPKKYKKKIFKIEPLLKKNHYLSKKNTTFNFKNKINIVILGGSQGADIFDNFIINLTKNLSKKININILQQVNNKNKIFNLEKKYKEIGINCKIFTYDENLYKILGNFNLAFTRCGASTMAEFVQYNIPFIGVPFPHAKDDHQYINAKYYESKNCCWIYRQEDLTVVKLEKLIKNILNNNNIYRQKYNSMVDLSYKNNWNNINNKLILN